MLNRMLDALQFQAQALNLRSTRAQLLASNMANADTPNYQARDFDFKSALQAATGSLAATSAAPLARTDSAHLATTGLGSAGPTLLYRTPTQTALDSNSVELDAERAHFADNSVRYEASLRFINGQIRTLLTAVNGQ
jgi:flagellar basal-body rod protein FlgB